MNKKDFFEFSYKYIINRLDDNLFKWNNRQESIIKKTKTGTIVISLYFNKYYSKYSFTESISIRIDAVEKISNYFTLKNHTEDNYTQTHATSLSTFTNNDLKEFHFKNEEELYEKLDIYIDFLNDNGLKYLNYCDNINILADLYINNKMDIHIASKGLFAYKTALILAILTKNNLESVAKEYKENYLIRFNDINDYSCILDTKLYEFAITGIIPDLPLSPYESPIYQPPPKPELEALIKMLEDN